MVAKISFFGEVAEHSRIYEFHKCALCSDVSRRKLFAKVMPLLLDTALFVHDPRFDMITADGWNND